MKEIEIPAAILGCLLLAGCGGNESEAKKAVLENLKDPDSAKFGKFSQDGESLACLTVNAKNSMGGYTGDKQALLKKLDGKWEFITTLEISHDKCIQMWPELEKK
jgi:outer membrane murein-binding lipoprotein Lpp